MYRSINIKNPLYIRCIVKMYLYLLRRIYLAADVDFTENIISNQITTSINTVLGPRTITVTEYFTFATPRVKKEFNPKKSYHIYYENLDKSLDYFDIAFSQQEDNTYCLRLASAPHFTSNSIRLALYEVLNILDNRIKNKQAGLELPYDLGFINKIDNEKEKI